jgi:hypothetical protein
VELWYILVLVKWLCGWRHCCYSCVSRTRDPGRTRWTLGEQEKIRLSKQNRSSLRESAPAWLGFCLLPIPSGLESGQAPLAPPTTQKTWPAITRLKGPQRDPGTRASKRRVRSHQLVWPRDCPTRAKGCQPHRASRISSFLSLAMTWCSFKASSDPVGYASLA